MSYPQPHLRNQTGRAGRWIVVPFDKYDSYAWGIGNKTFIDVAIMGQLLRLPWNTPYRKHAAMAAALNLLHTRPFPG
jgi:hypothetical protein